MNEINYFRGIKIWLIALFSFDILIFSYLIVSGRVLEIEPVFPELITTISGLILALSVVVGFVSIIYSIVQKEYNYIIHGLGILFCSLVLYFAIVIIALASIF